MAYLMGIDIGTSSTKVLIIDSTGNIAAKASQDYPISVPHPGYAEQDPEWWWNAVKESVRKALKTSKVCSAEIEAVGLSGQMHGTVLLGKDYKSLRPAIIWADRRSSSQCTAFYERLGKEKALDIVRNPIMPGFMGPSLLWLKEHEPSIFKETSKILLPKDYIGLRLTGSLATDVSDASATLLFDVKRREWSSYVASQLGFSMDIFPEAFESTGVIGYVSSDETGLPRGIPVVAGGGDSQAGAVGCGAIKEGIVSSNIGTGGQIFVTLDAPEADPKHRVHTFCHAVPGKWCLQGAILSAGLSLNWLRGRLLRTNEPTEALSDADAYDLLSREAETAEPGCRGLVFLPYLLGERSPHMDPDARGGFLGLTFEHSRADMIRAVMEGAVYALRDCLEVFKELGVETEKAIARGGGSRSALWRQIQADVFNAELTRTAVEEEASFGAALLAGVGVAVYRNLEEACAQAIQTVGLEAPNAERVRIYEGYYREIYRKLYPALKGLWS